MHYTEDDLILYYYGEHRRRVQVEQHLTACTSCRALYGDIAGKPGARHRPDVPERERPVRPRSLAAHPSAVARAGGTMVGRLDPPASPCPCGCDGGARAGRVRRGALVAPADPQVQPTSAATEPAPTPDAGERVRRAAVGDHLEESERVLLDFVNAYGTAEQPANVSAQQQWAADLISANRLYRDASTPRGTKMVAAVLDELERSLLELVHGPATLTPQELDQIRLRLDAAALLFRVRVLSDRLRERETASPTPRNTI